jgi:ZIP family zinc transporter
LVVALGFLSGAVFMWLSDKIVTSARRENVCKNRKRANRIFMLVLSITLHNIPEGLAVGVAFGALHAGGYTADALMGAVTIALGIGLQNFPEGAAVALPLRREGYSARKSFFMGQASGMVEPIAGVLGAAMVVYMETILPFALAFAAGTMILVAVHELIPECQQNQDANPYFATMGIVFGFALMMVLDVSLG